MTEDEARTKFCPQTFGIPDVRDGEGNGIMQGGPWTCRGSACMAWRLTNWSADPADPTGRSPHRTDLQFKPNDGFCGLAGHPRSGDT